MAPLVVADASVLIALGQLDNLSLLQKLFMEVLVPPAVVVEASLDPGETEAISLAL